MSLLVSYFDEACSVINCRLFLGQHTSLSLTDKGLLQNPIVFPERELYYGKCSFTFDCSSDQLSPKVNNKVHEAWPWLLDFFKIFNFGISFLVLDCILHRMVWSF